MHKICLVAILLWFSTQNALGQGLARAFSLDECLDTIRAAESSGQDSAVGDGGRSRGAWQIQENTWRRYSKLPWVIYAHNKKEARTVAGCIISDIIRHCKKYHSKDYIENPLRVICMHYNAGINTKLTPERWHRRTRNAIYKAL